MKASTLLGGKHLPGNFVTDPKHFPKLSVNRDQDLLKANQSTAYNSNESSFWISLNYFGSYAQISAVDTYVVVADVSGEGVAGNIILPMKYSTSNTYVSTVRITLDGVPFEFSASPVAASSYMLFRPVMGPLFPFPPQIASVQDALAIGSYLDQGWDNYAMESYAWPPLARATLATPAQLVALGMPVLYFEESLYVEVKCDALSGSAYELRGGATYMLLS